MGDERPEGRSLFRVSRENVIAIPPILSLITPTEGFNGGGSMKGGAK